MDLYIPFIIVSVLSGILGTLCVIMGMVYLRQKDKEQISFLKTLIIDKHKSEYVEKNEAEWYQSMIDELDEKEKDPKIINLNS